MTAPIALFVYNRPQHTRRTVDALRANLLADESDLFVYADAPRDDAAIVGTSAVRTYVRGIEGFRSLTIIERETNQGVDASIIDAVTDLCDRYGEVIALEDDLVTSRWFLQFMNDGLARYRDEATVMQVGGFMFPIGTVDGTAASLLPYSTCWGWATWQRAWTQFDRDGSIYAALKTDRRRRRAFNLDDTYDYFGLLESFVEGRTSAWDIRWYATVFAANGLSLFPRKTLVDNIGFDGSGVHCEASDLVVDELNTDRIVSFPEVERDDAVWRSIEGYLRAKRPRLTLTQSLRRVALRLYHANARPS